MRNIFIILFTLLCVATSCSKVDKNMQNEPKQKVNDEARYELYSTQNIWTFLKLDTRTGRIWQVQYSLEEGKRGEWILNGQPLTQNSEGKTDVFSFIQPVTSSILFCSIIPMVRPTKCNGAKKKSFVWLFP